MSALHVLHRVNGKVRPSYPDLARHIMSLPRRKRDIIVRSLARRKLF
jgi:hypothetical protein